MTLAANAALGNGNVKRLKVIKLEKVVFWVGFSSMLLLMLLVLILLLVNGHGL